MEVEKKLLYSLRMEHTTQLRILNVLVVCFCINLSIVCHRITSVSNFFSKLIFLRGQRWARHIMANASLKMLAKGKDCL